MRQSAEEVIAYIGVAMAIVFVLFVFAQAHNSRVVSVDDQVNTWLQETAAKDGTVVFSEVTQYRDSIYTFNKLNN